MYVGTTADVLDHARQATQWESPLRADHFGASRAKGTAPPRATKGKGNESPSPRNPAEANGAYTRAAGTDSAITGTGTGMPGADTRHDGNGAILNHRPTGLADGTPCRNPTRPPTGPKGSIPCR